MPELPEVEVTRIGISNYINSNTIKRIVAYSTNLRWPISPDIFSILPGETINSVERRGKYLLLKCQSGILLIHLGMTGQLRIVTTTCTPEKHDHLDIVFIDEVVLRLNDARRFGSVFWVDSNLEHKFIEQMGPEPLSEEFDGNYLYQKSRGRKIIVKKFLLDQQVVAGIGNIYANEALFHAGIHPSIPAGRISKVRYKNLVVAIKLVLATSIKLGGTMIDFRDGTEKNGHFPQKFSVYNRSGRPCTICGTQIQYKRVMRRSIYFCKSCQK